MMFELKWFFYVSIVCVFVFVLFLWVLPVVFNGPPAVDSEQGRVIVEQLRCRLENGGDVSSC